jgi:CRISPR system Cascade subunit CasD
MNQYLVFQLQGPMASWGEPAPGEVRHTNALPGRSSLLGLLAAALGIRRDEEDKLALLHQHYQFILCANEKPSWMRDYHTVQVPKAVRNMRWRTRREELQDKALLETTISRRDFYCDGYWLVMLAMTEGAPWSLERLRQALQFPEFPLYLGRKSHPLALPLWPQIYEGLAGDVLLNAQEAFLTRLSQLPGAQRLGRLQPVCWWEGQHAGLKEEIRGERRDQPISRRRWQFAPRVYSQGTAFREES